jgi:hypothetical protein
MKKSGWMIRIFSGMILVFLFLSPAGSQQPLVQVIGGQRGSESRCPQHCGSQARSRARGESGCSEEHLGDVKGSTH